MACGIGVCMTCVLPVVGEDGRDPVRPGPAPRGRCSAATGCASPTSARCPWDVVGADAMGVVAAVTDSGRRPAVDMSTSLGPVPIPSPVLTASGCSAFGRELRAVRRPGRDRRGGDQVGAAAAAVGPADPADGRDAQRDAQLDRPAGPRHRRPARRRPALAGRARRPGVRLDRRHPRRGLRRAGRAGCAACPGVLGLEVNISCPNVESRGEVFACDPVAALRRRRRRPGRRRPGAAGLRQAQPGRHRHRRASPARCVDAGADGLSMINTLLGLVIDPDTCGRCSAGSPAGCPARRSGRWRCAASGRCTRRCPRCRSSAWAGSAPAWTPCSSCSPARRAVSVGTAVFNDPSALGPGARRAGRRARRHAGSPGSPTPSATPTAPGRPRDAHPELRCRSDVAPFGRRLPRPSPRAGRCAWASTRTGRCWSTGASATTWTGCAGSPTLVVDALAGRVAVLKPQIGVLRAASAPAGSPCWRRRVARARAAGALVLLDAKRGDIGSTMDAYADYLRPGHPMAVDAMTVSPYLGPGSLEPAVDTARALRRRRCSCWPARRTRTPARPARGRRGPDASPRPSSTRCAAGTPPTGSSATRRRHRRLRDQRAAGAATGSFGVVVGAHAAASWTSTSTAWAARSSPPASARRAARSADLRRLFGAGRAVVPTVSRDVLGAGPTPRRCAPPPTGGRPSSAAEVGGRRGCRLGAGRPDGARAVTSGDGCLTCSDGAVTAPHGPPCGGCSTPVCPMGHAGPG